MTLRKVLTICISLVWLINGLYCKLLGFVPRHAGIVARILGAAHASLITRVIGALEILMAIWILSRVRSRLCAIAQVMVVAIMNIIEAVLAPDLLLFGKMNALIALFFISVVMLTEFYLPDSGATKKQ